MPRIKCFLSYDGTSYFGWQKTKTGPSIQETLEAALFQVTRHTIATEAASRTDRGVHAKGQVLHFDIPTFSKERDLPQLQRQLNGVLPHTIRIQSLEEAAPNFHSTLDATGKEYHYLICNGSTQIPFHRLYSWFFSRPLNLNAMRQAADELLGTHDFSSFTSEPEDNPLCTLFQINIAPLEKNRLRISLHGNRFLYKMARTLVGTLIYIGCEKLPQTIVPRLFSSRNRAEAGMTAPAHGLFLFKVFYKEPPL